MAAKKFRAQSVTTPKKAAKKRAAKYAGPTRTLPTAKKPSTKKQRGQSITVPVSKPIAAKAAKEAKKVYKQERVDHFTDAMAATDSVPQAVMSAEGSVTYGEALDIMKSPQVIRDITAKRQSLAAEAGITSLGIMLHYRAIGFSNMNRFGRLLLADSVVTELQEMDPMDTAAIQELTTETYWDESAEKEVKRVKLKLYPKEVALNKMAQHLGIKGFGGQLEKAGSKVGVETVVSPDGTVTTRAILSTMSDEELERIAAGEDDDMESERTE